MNRPPPPPLPPGRSIDSLVSWDRLFATLALFMWGGTAVKVAPSLSAVNNAQSAVGMAAIFLVAVAWPTLHQPSYVRCRIPALSALRLFIFALPFNFNTEVFDAIAPDVATGKLAWMANASQLFLGTRVALMIFSSLGWQLPLRLHMVLQALKFGLLVRFGVHPYCSSKLLTSPQVNAGVSAVHSVMAFLAMPLVPPAAVIVPESDYAQRVTILLFSWSVLGWLMPTLLLLPEGMGHGSRAAAQGRQQRSRRGAAALLAAVAASCSALVARLAAYFEHSLSKLLPASRQQAEQHLPTRVSCTLRWWAVLLVAWGACCAASPLFVPLGSAAAGSASS